MVTVEEGTYWPLEREILDLIADKWAMLIVNALGSGTLRFTELKVEVVGISHKMLAQTLRGLERNGILTRRVYATVPPRVDYTLTETGIDLLDTAMRICAWTSRHKATIERARANFQAPPASPNGR